MSSHVRARAYACLKRARGPSRWRAACLYFGAGLLNVEDFRAPGAVRWEAYGDEGTGLVAWENEVYGAVIRPSDRVLLIGCGSGRDLLALRRRGCGVTGVEQSPTMAARARATLSRHGLPTLVVAEPIESYVATDTFDAIVFSPYTYSYILGSASRVAILARLRERLSPRGRVILSYVGLTRQSALWILLARISSIGVGSDWWPEAGDRLYAPLSHPDALGFEHQFLPDELARECGLAGLHIVRDEPISAFFRFAVATQ
jgi:SAM-dependent methyltransferase